MDLKNRYNFLLLLGSIVFCLACGEILIATLGDYDKDGNFHFRDRILKPYCLPVVSVAQEIERYQTSGSPIFEFDPTLGWKPKPGGRSNDGFYRYNSVGLRSEPREFSMTPENGVLRLALFGDSFTHGSEVKFEDTWGHHLEKDLAEVFEEVEVLNFGVSGYGMDQAFLRWKTFGNKFSPGIVILGFVAVDIKRNLNLIRTISSPTVGLPFAKPRFIMDGDELRLINIPVPPPGKTIDFMQRFTHSEMAGYEYYYDPDDYETGIWQESKFVTSVLNFISMNKFNYEQAARVSQERFYARDGEPVKLTLKIVEEFKKDVVTHGAKYVILHMPTLVGLKRLLEEKELAYAGLLQELDENYCVIHPERELMAAARSSSVEELFRPNRHYSPKGCQILAKVIADYISDNREKLGLDL